MHYVLCKNLCCGLMTHDSRFSYDHYCAEVLSLILLCTTNHFKPMIDCKKEKLSDLSYSQSMNSKSLSYDKCHINLTLLEIMAIAELSWLTKHVETLSPSRIVQQTIIKRLQNCCTQWLRSAEKTALQLL